MIRVSMVRSTPAEGSTTCGTYRSRWTSSKEDRSQPKDRVPRSDLVAKRLADLGDAEGRPHPGRAEHVGEVDEDALCRLGPEIDLGAGVLDRSDEGLEHQVELTGFGELTAIVGMPW